MYAIGIIGIEPNKHM